MSRNITKQIARIERKSYNAIIQAIEDLNTLGWIGARRQANTLPQIIKLHELIKRLDYAAARWIHQLPDEEWLDYINGTSRNNNDN